jgi:hypothetical protein
VSDADLKTLCQIADLAHCSGLAGLHEGEALVAIRRLTLMYWDRMRHVDQMQEDAKAALRASLSAPTFSIRFPIPQPVELATRRTACNPGHPL